MGEMTSKLKFRTAPALTSAEFRTGSTAYEAEAEGVKYRVVGIPKILGAPGSGRTFRAYRVVEGGKLHPAAGGGTHRTRAAAYEQAERDLANVLRDRQAQDVAARTAARVDAEVPTCPAGTACTGAAYPGHPAHAVREIEWSKPICPDAEAGKQHGAHRIEGTWREHCPGVEADNSESVQEREERLASPPFTVKIDVSAAEAGVVDYVRKLIRENAPKPAPVPTLDPATDDNVHELLDRIVRRSQYVALREVLAQLDGWIERAEKTCRAEDHGDGSSHDDGRPCGRDFDVADFRTMVNGAADELRVPRPYRPAVDDA